MQETMNGVDRSALVATIAAVEADPTLAAFEFRLDNSWVDGGLNRSAIDGFFGTGTELRHAQPFTLVNDEPAVLLSGDQGPNPVEYVLHALAGCLTTSLVYHAAARGRQLRAVRTRFAGDLDLRGFLGMADEVRNGYSQIRVAFEIDAEMSEAEKAELMALAQARSPVFDIVTHGVPVRCELAKPQEMMA
jgi:uncharacterized OsmC-like protein